MIDHVSVGTNNIARAREFYDSVLGCLGLRLLHTSEHSAD
jgi:catechol 2,3-dioxygenase-like lactoylglutathione lyase family enzyme